MPPDDPYTHGHHESVLRSHSMRTVENSAGYLIQRTRFPVDAEHLSRGDPVEHSTGELADLFGVTRSTVYRALERSTRHTATSQ